MGGEQNFGSSGGLADGQWHHGAIVNFNDGGHHALSPLRGRRT